MKWTVRYRNSAGSQVEAVIEADSRDSVFAELKRRGIQAIEVARHNDSRSKGGKPFALKSSFRVCATIITLSVLVAVGIVGWRIVAQKKATGSQQAPSTKRQSRPTSFRPTHLNHTQTNAPKRNVSAKAKPKDTFNGKEVVSRQAVTNANGTVIERIFTSDGKSHRVTHPQKSVFENPSDQLIAMAVSGKYSGIAMPPLPMSASLEEDFRKSLNTPIEILDSDSDEIKLMKLNVKAVREDLKELVAQGMTVRQALTEHQAEVNRIAAYHQDALRIYNDIKKTDGVEAANTFLNSVNEKLDKLGVAPVEASSFSRSEQNTSTTGQTKDDQQ